MKIEIRKFGLKSNPVGLHVKMTCHFFYHGPQEITGTIRDVYYDERTSTVRLIVTHFNGEMWPLHPLASAVEII